MKRKRRRRERKRESKEEVFFWTFFSLGGGCGKERESQTEQVTNVRWQQLWSLRLTKLLGGRERERERDGRRGRRTERERDLGEA